jgi:hypothetical protein
MLRNVKARKPKPADGPIAEAQIEELKKLQMNGDAAEGLTAWMANNGYDVWGDIPMSRFEEAKEACK